MWISVSAYQYLDVNSDILRKVDFREQCVDTYKCLNVLNIPQPQINTMRGSSKVQSCSLKFSSLVLHPYW